MSSDETEQKMRFGLRGSTRAKSTMQFVYV